MRAGVTIYNDSNTIQIDDRYSNMQLVQKGTLTQARNVVSVKGTFPVMALYFKQPSTGTQIACFQEAVIKRGDTWEFTLSYTLGGRLLPGTVFEYYCFDIATPSRSWGGLQVYKEDGVTLSFDSETPYFKSLGSFRVANYKTIGVHPVPAGTKVGVVFGRFPGRTQQYYQPQGSMCFSQYYTAGVDMVDSGVRVSETWFFSRADLGVCRGVNTEFNEFTYMLVDLSNM